MNTDEQSNAAADICAEMAREYDAKANKLRGTEAMSSVDDNFDDVADALREAERRIRAGTGSAAPSVSQQPEVFCEKMDEWAALISNSSGRINDPTAFRKAWQEVRLAISKSCLLSRTMYGGEKPSQTPCPVHEGKWSGLHHGWPETVWNTGAPIKEAEELRKWYDAGCRCAYHKACNCTTGWQPDAHCGCVPLPTPPDPKEQT